MDKNMTALISLFARAYHFEHNDDPIFGDNVAGKLLSEEEKNNIRQSMASGIHFFCPGFSGNQDEALSWIVNNQLAPSVLARSAFCEYALADSANRGCRQYLVFAAGYDTYAQRNQVSGLKVYELEQIDMILDKKKRLFNAGFDLSKAAYLACDFLDPDWISALEKSSYEAKSLSFGSLLGISYYLSQEDFRKTMHIISTHISKGSEVVFYYQTKENSEVTNKNERLARAAGEPMKGKYSHPEIKALIEKCGFTIHEYLDFKGMTKRFFMKSKEMTAPKGIAYVLAVKE